MSKKNKDLIVGLDIGTSKIIAVVADITEEGKPSIIGMESQESRGLKKGMVVNIEETVTAISRAIQEAERMAGYKVREVYTSLSGSHIQSFNSVGTVVIKDKEVTPDDVERAIKMASARAIPVGQKVLHVLPQEFVIDGQGGIRDPIRINGQRLEAKVHIVTCALSATQNIVKCVRRAGLDIANNNGTVLAQLASSHAVLTEDEKDLGVCLIDIGGGTTDIAVWHQGAIRHSSVIPIAGDQVTGDITMAFHTSTQDAEYLKCQYGYALEELANPEDCLDVTGRDAAAPRKYSRLALAKIIQLRIEELYELAQLKLRQAGFEKVLSSGIVLTGGTAVMHGMIKLGEKIFCMPVRLGVPRYQGNLADIVQAPRFATTFGLLLEAQIQKATPSFSKTA